MAVWITNAKKLRDWLKKDGFKKLAVAPGFAFNDAVFEVAKAEVVRQHPEETDPDLRTAYRLLTRPKPKPKVEPGVTRIELKDFLPKWLKVGFGILVLALLSVIAARSQTVIIQDEGTNKIRRAGGQVGANFIGAGVSCGTAVAGIVPCTITGSGSSTFLLLTDTPGSYSGQALLCTRVNAGETAIEFVACGSGGGHVITLNGAALASATAADFDDATPAAPANGFNVKWQKDALDPTNISAYFDTTTMATSTWGSGSAITLTYNVGAVDPVVAYTSGNIKWSGATTYTFEGGATDPVWTPGNNLMNLSTGALQQGGTAVGLVGTCTNQFVRAVNNAAPTCETVVAADKDLTEAQTWTGLHTFVPSGLGGLTNYDASFGDTDGSPTYGIGRFGNSIFGRTSFIAGSLDLDGAILSQNGGGPVTSSIEFAWQESGTSVRFAIPTSGADLGTYSPRSLIVAGPAPANSNMVNCDTWTTDNTNIDCNTATTGADLFVQDDAEIEGTVFAGVLTEGGNPVPNDTDHLGFFAATTVAQLAGVLSNEDFTPGSETSAEGVLDVEQLQTALTAARCVRVNAGGTALEAAAADCNTAGGAPSDATYITQTSNATLSAEQALDALASGIMRVDTAAGVITSLTDSAGIATNISDETGSGVMVFGTTPTIATPIVTGKSNRNAVSVNDDDCTGEQGEWWYDDTDSAFEFCNANSGTPTVLGNASFTASSTDTLTNKTYDVEGTGNVFTSAFHIEWQAGTCIGGTATSNFDDSPLLTEPAVACVAGTNITSARLDFDDGTDEGMQISFVLPDGWTGSIEFDFYWHGTAIVNEVMWALQTICVADAETLDPSFNTAQTVEDTAKGTANQLNIATISSVTTTGCAAGERMFLHLFRDANNASDDFSGDARLVSTRLTGRRTQ